MCFLLATAATTVGPFVSSFETASVSLFVEKFATETLLYYTKTMKVIGEVTHETLLPALTHKDAVLVVLTRYVGPEITLTLLMQAARAALCPLSRHA